MKDNKVIYKFYKKPILSNKHKVILSNSTRPAHVKRASITEGAIRRLRYTRCSLPWSEVAEILSVYSNELRLSVGPAIQRMTHGDLIDDSRDRRPGTT